MKTLRRCLIAIALVALAFPVSADSLNPPSEDNPSHPPKQSAWMNNTAQSTGTSSASSPDIGWNGWVGRRGLADELRTKREQLRLVLFAAVFEPVRDDAGLHLEQLVADDGAIIRNLNPGYLFDQLRQRVELVVINADVDAVHRQQRHDGVFRRRIAGAFAESEYGGMDDLGAFAEGQQRIRHADAEILMEMGLESRVRKTLPDSADEELHGMR